VARPQQGRLSLTDTERQAIVVAAQSTFLKLANLYEELLPIFNRFGFKPQSAGVVSRDVSEKIEEQIVLHCSTFTKGLGFADLARHGQRWEVKICKGNRLTINQNARINGENYIVVNYTKFSTLRRVWILWEAEDRFFTPRKENLNLRTVILNLIEQNSETIFDGLKGQAAARSRGLSMAKASLRPQARRRRA
jgi:hypothetical protein